MVNISRCGDIIDLISVSKNWYNCGKKGPVSLHDKYRVLGNEIILFQFYSFYVLHLVLYVTHIILIKHYQNIRVIYLFIYLFSPGATTPIEGCILQPSNGL